ncbi:MAG: FAD-dependent oxidoreductase [Pseudomonadota bacterium]
MDRFDIIVIGGGMMGAPCARHLAEAGHRVALVAPPEPVAGGDGPWGSHFDAARITRHVAADADWARLSARSIARYGDLEARSGRRIFRDVGAVMAGPRDGEMGAWTAGFAAVAREVSGAALIDPVEAEARIGLRLPAGSVVSLEAKGGGWIDPRAMRDAQQALAEAAGATLIRQPAITRSGGDVTLADGSSLSAGHVVVATGPYAPLDGLMPARPAIRVWARTIAFARLSETEGARLAAMPSAIWVPEGWDHDLYMLPPVRYPDGYLYLKIGGQTDSPLIHSSEEMRYWFHGPGDATVGARLMAEMRAVLPELDVAEESTGPCAVVWTETGYPYIERLDDRVTALCGGNGAAAKCGDELGRLGAVLATGGTLEAEGYDADFRGVWR